MFKFVVKYLSFAIKLFLMLNPCAHVYAFRTSHRLSLRKGGMLGTVYPNLYLTISNSLIVSLVVKSINN